MTGIATPITNCVKPLGRSAPSETFERTLSTLLRLQELRRDRAGPE